MPTTRQPSLVGVAPEPISIPARLALIAAAIGRVEKKGFNSFHKYQYVRETDLVDTIRPLLSEHNLWLRQTVSSHSKEDDLTCITVDFTWIATDTGETLGPDTFIGYGSDKGDKGIYKALTGTVKYYLMKTFLVSTGDDPEGDENTDKRAEAKGAAEAPVIRRAAARDVARGGKQAAATDVQVEEMVRLARGVGIVKSTDLAEFITRTSGVPILIEPENPKESLLTSLRLMSAADIGKVIQALTIVTDAAANPADDFEVVGDETLE